MNRYFRLFPVSFFALLSTAHAQETEPDTVVVTAGSDPVIAAVRADALDHKGKTVAQTCVISSNDEDGQRQVTQRYTTEGPDAFKWQITDLLIDGKPASDKELQKTIKKRQKRQKKADEDDDRGYEQFAELIADKDRIERLAPMDGMRRYRINRLPDSIAKDMPEAIAKRLKPILWIADPEGEPYVRRLEVALGDFRMFLIAKIKSADFDIYFERRDDGYVKERQMRYDMNYSLFGSNKFNRGEANCDVGGPIVKRSPSTSSGSPVSP